MREPDFPGALEVVATRRFFQALAARDPARLAELLAPAPRFENVDGPIAVEGRAALAHSLVGREEGVEYALAEVEASPGQARARFLLLVDGVPGSIVLDAQLSFAEGLIAAIRVVPPE